MVKHIFLWLFITVPVFAQNSFYEDNGRGWFWYESPPVLGEETYDLHNEPAQAEKALEALQKDLEAKKALAVMQPTFENVQNYIEVHNAALQQSREFANMWQYVLWQTPELDFTVKNPTSSTGRHVYYDEQKVKAVNTIQNLNSEYGLFFFFKESCQYCHAFAPILKDFERQHGLEVVAISLDGGTLPEYPDARVDNGAAETLGVTMVPALLAVHPETQAIVPISYGLITQDELTRRIMHLTPSSQGEIL